MSERSLQRGLRARQVVVQTSELQRMPKGNETVEKLYSGADLFAVTSLCRVK